eukprot:2963267-Rhodomonas_salina.1
MGRGLRTDAAACPRGSSCLATDEAQMLTLELSTVTCSSTPSCPQHFDGVILRGKDSENLSALPQ